MTPPAAFLDRPLAHRGLHDRDRGIIENSGAAFEAAIKGGYGIEVDVQISSDGVPVVFHDDDLERLTGQTGLVRHRSAAELTGIELLGSANRILTLETVLERVGDRAPVLVEIKDQTFFPAPAPIDEAVGRVLSSALRHHAAQLAVMSFNPGYIRALEELPAPIARGLTSMPADTYPDTMPRLTREAMGRIEGFAPGMSFVSHHHEDLANPRVAELKKAGASVLCWTIRSPEEEAAARRIADNVTFEGYPA